TSFTCLPDCSMPTVAKERVANRRTLVRMATSRRTLAVAAGQARSTSRSPLDAPAQYVKGVGPARAEQLARLGLHTVEDLLYHVPHRYEDRSHLASIASLVPGQRQATQGVFLALSEKRRGTYQFVAALSDETGVLPAVSTSRRSGRRCGPFTSQPHSQRRRRRIAGWRLTSF